MVYFPPFSKLFTTKVASGSPIAVRFLTGRKDGAISGRHSRIVRTSFSFTLEMLTRYLSFFRNVFDVLVPLSRSSSNSLRSFLRIRCLIRSIDAAGKEAHKLPGTIEPFQKRLLWRVKVAKMFPSFAPRSGTTSSFVLVSILRRLFAERDDGRVAKRLERLDFPSLGLACVSRLLGGEIYLFLFRSTILEIHFKERKKEDRDRSRDNSVASSESKSSASCDIYKFTIPTARNEQAFPSIFQGRSK